MGGLGWVGWRKMDPRPSLGTDSGHAKCARCIYQRRCTRRRSVKASWVKWRYRVPAVDVCWFDQRCLDVNTRTRFVHIRPTRRPSTTAPVSKPWTSYRLSATVGVSVVVFSSVCWLQLASGFATKCCSVLIRAVSKTCSNKSKQCQSLYFITFPKMTADFGNYFTTWLRPINSFLIRLLIK